MFLLTDEQGFSIDGNFSDWNDTPKIVDDKDQSNTAIDSVRSAVVSEGEYLYFYIETTGDMFQGIGSKGDILRIFIDSDTDSGTGYSIHGLGADYFIEFYGINGEILSSNYYEYYPFHRTNAPRGQTDWNAWAPMFSVDAEVSGSQLETKLWMDELGINPDINPTILIQLSDPLGNRDFSPVLSEKGAVSLEVTGSGATILVPGEDIDYMSIHMENLGSITSRIQGMTFSLHSPETGMTIDEAFLILEDAELAVGSITRDGVKFGNIAIEVEDTLELQLRLGISGDAVPGRGISMELTEVESEAGIHYPDSTISAYISEVPLHPVVDGLFMEWSGTRDDPIGETENPAVDIASFETRDHENSTYLYLRVLGDVLSGNIIPQTRAMGYQEKPAGSTEETNDSVMGNQEEHPLPVETGEDTIFIFLPSVEGYRVRQGFYSDMMIRVTGIEGRITESILMEFNGDSSDDFSWMRTQSVPAMAHGSEIELALDDAVYKEAYFRVMSWNDETDHAHDTGDVTVVIESESGNSSVNVKGTRGDTIIVDANGNGDFTSIQDGIDDATAGDTIRVWAGTYEETVTVDKRLELKGNGSANSIIDGGNFIEEYGVYVDVDSVVIDGFGIKNNELHGIRVSSSSNRFRNNNLSDNGKSGIALRKSQPAGNNIIENNVFWKNGNTGIHIQSATGNNYIANNTLISNVVGGINLNRGENNEILNTTISNSPVALMLSGWIAGNYMNDSKIMNSSTADVILEKGSSITFTNVTFDYDAVNCDTGCKLTVKNKLKIEVLDVQGDPLKDADVQVKENNVEAYASSGYGGSDPKTDSDGLTPWIIVTDVIYDGSDSFTNYITYINVSKTGNDFGDLPKESDMSTTHTETIQAIPEFQLLFIPPFAVLTSFFLVRKRKLLQKK